MLDTQVSVAYYSPTLRLRARIDTALQALLTDRLLQSTASKTFQRDSDAGQVHPRQVAQILPPSFMLRFCSPGRKRKDAAAQAIDRAGCRCRTAFQTSLADEPQRISADLCTSAGQYIRCAEMSDPPDHRAKGSHSLHTLHPLHLRCLLKLHSDRHLPNLFLSKPHDSCCTLQSGKDQYAEPQGTQHSSGEITVATHSTAQNVSSPYISSGVKPKLPMQAVSSANPQTVKTRATPPVTVFDNSASTARMTVAASAAPSQPFHARSTRLSFTEAASVFVLALVILAVRL